MINVSPHKLWEFYGTDFATDFEKSPIEGESALNYSIEGKEGIEKVLNFSTYNNYFDLKKKHFNVFFLYGLFTTVLQKNYMSTCTFSISK